MNTELQKLFDQAVDFQSQGKDIEAFQIYKSINQQDVTSPAIELNKALILEKQEDWGHAFASIDKAQFLARSPWLANDRVERIQKEVGGNRAYAVGSLGEIAHESGKILRPQEGFLIAAMFFGFYLLVRGIGFRHRGFFSTVVIAILLTIYSAIPYLTSPTKYVVSDTELKALPLEESTSKNNLAKGAKVQVLKERGDFAQVSRPGDFTGWISKKALSD